MESEELVGVVYLITNTIDGKQYVGKTNDFERRWRTHCNGRHMNSLLDRAIKKYGPENFTTEILGESEYDKALLLFEVEMIAELNTQVPSGYNITPGGEGNVGNTSRLGRPHTNETRARMRSTATKAEVRKARSDGARRSRGFSGHTHSEATKAKMRQDRKGGTLGFTGRRHSEESKKRTSEALKGKPKPGGHGAKVSAYQTGRTKSEEHRKHLSEAMNKPETRQVLSEKAKIREARKKDELSELQAQIDKLEALLKGRG